LPTLSASQKCFIAGRCNSYLVEIDRDGERLTGCLQCNRWQSSKHAFVVELSAKELKALREKVGLREKPD